MGHHSHMELMRLTNEILRDENEKLKRKVELQEMDIAALTLENNRLRNDPKRQKEWFEQQDQDEVFVKEMTDEETHNSRV